MKTHQNYFSQNLKFLLSGKGMSQLSCAKALGLSQGALSNYANGRCPKAQLALRIARFFKCDVHDLFNTSIKQERYLKLMVVKKKHRSQSPTVFKGTITFHQPCTLTIAEMARLIVQMAISVNL